MNESVIHVLRAGDSYTADWGDGPRRCAVGRGGIGEKLKEDDGITPAGLWPLRRILYRADRLTRPPCALNAAPITRQDGWCDAPGDANYNKQVKLPYPASAESLWRADALYDVVVVVGYNDIPIMAGKGSAIFMHIAQPDYAPTEGCVALACEDLLQALSGLTPQALLDIHP